jgi:hypothetical protein
MPVANVWSVQVEQMTLKFNYNYPVYRTPVVYQKLREQTELCVNMFTLPVGNRLAVLIIFSAYFLI